MCGEVLSLWRSPIVCGEVLSLWWKSLCVWGSPDIYGKVLFLSILESVSVIFSGILAESWHLRVLRESCSEGAPVAYFTAWMCRM